jgi:hypothetical protein
MAGPPQAYQTYAVHSPQDVTVPAACEQVGCEARRLGWRSLIDERSDLGREQARYIRRRSGRTFTERPGPDGLTEFAFGSGQRCFADHRTRPERFGTWAGDVRARLGATRWHVTAADWLDDFGAHQQRIADQHQRG